VVSCALLSSPPLEAQHLPGDTGAPTAAEQNATFHQEIRSQLAATLQEWVNVWESEQAETLARYYTDEALVLTAEGVTRGRDAIAMMWRERLPTLSDLSVELGEVLPGASLAAATGRLSYQVTPPDGAPYRHAEQFLMVFDEQRGRWMIRAQAFAPSAVSAGGRDVLQASRRAVHPPQLVTVRLIGEAFGGRSAAAGLPEMVTWDVVGGGLGIELGRLLELRGQAWQEMGAATSMEPLRSYSGELRVHVGSVWRFLPNLSVGAGRITGTATPDEEVIPVLGMGVGIEITNALRLQLAARNYLHRKLTSEEHHWINAPREQRWLFSGGLGFAVGRDPVWRDPARTPLQEAYEASLRPAVLRALDEWLEAAPTADPQRLERVYAMGAMLLVPGGDTHRTMEAIRRYWQENGQKLSAAKFEVADLRVSGDLALVTARLRRDGSGSAAPSDAGFTELVTVLERSNQRWRIRTQALVEPTARSSNPESSIE
jgi:uncharacterized protein (TIGR02246 family)